MRVTKLYLYIVRFAVGSDRLDEDFDVGSLNQAIYRAQSIPSHLIRISSYEDESDASDMGLATKRAEALRSAFLEESVDGGRIQLLCPQQRDESVERRGDYFRRSEICLFPKVASLGDDDSFLTPEEIHALQTAREISLFPPNEYTDTKRELLDRFTEADWKRIVGFKTIDEWASNGAKHPLYEIGSSDRARKRPWWSLW